MPWDSDMPPPSARDMPPAHPTDLEAITLLLEIGGIILTTGPDSRFSEDDLIRKAQELGAPDCSPDAEDARNVLSHMHVFKRCPDGMLRLR